MVFRRISFALAAWLALVVPAFGSGDSANFVNLGFSADGRVYMFAQYGVLSGSLRPWADVFIIDVESGALVPGGSASFVHDRPIVAGQNGSGAMHAILAGNTLMAEQHDVVFPNQGQPLYIALTGDPALSGQPITFRDFSSNEAVVFYEASLSQSIQGSGESLRSSFVIDLKKTHRGETRTFRLGSPVEWRTGVISYHIRQVLVSPSGSSLVFVIETRHPAGNTHNVRYMVQTLRL
ncbi:MAG: DUF2259 domain-containing protein [Treponema sp.]|nr:DUF2259 domain-containing protein [Treponema sp.]